MLKKIGVLSFLIAATLHGEVSVELDKSVIKNNGENRNFIVQPKVSKNTYTVTQEQIQEKNYKNVEDVLRDSPGVIVQNTAFGPKVDMRGSGEKSLSRVKVMVDGISINPTEEAMASLPINSIPIESVKKIEIIPGGGATLYGSGSVGGVVNIVTNSNATKDNFFMDLKYGSYENRGFGFSGGHNINEKLYVNYGFNYRNSEGYRKHVDDQDVLFLGGFDYKFNENNKIRFQLRNGKQNEDNTTEIPKALLAKDRRAPGLNLDHDSKNESYTFDYGHRVNKDMAVGLTLYNKTQKRTVTSESIDDIIIIASDRNHTYAQQFFKFFDVKSTLHAKFHEKKDGLKLKGTYNYGHGDLILGYDYYKAVNKRNSFVQSEILKTYSDGYSYVTLSPGDILPVTNKVDIKLEKEVHSLYAFNKYQITDNLDFTAGVRGELTKYEGYRNNGPNTMPKISPKSQRIDTNRKLKNYAAELGSLYKYNDTGSAYVRVEQGFVTPFASQLTDKIHDTDLKNPGGIFVPPIVNVSSIYVKNNLKAETTHTAEVGLRDYLFDVSSVALSLFITDTDNEITAIHSGVTNPAVKRWKYRNIGKTRRMGAELETEQYFDKLSLSQSVTLVDAKVIKGSKAYGIEKGQKVPMVPTAKITLGAKYNLSEKIDLTANYTYVSKKTARELDENDNVCEYTIKGHGVVDTGLIYKIDSYSNLKFGIKNLTNQKYNLRETSIEAYPAPERNYYMELTVKY